MANVPISAFTVPANTVGIGATGYSLTGSASASFMDLAGTWNTSGTPTAIKLNITETGAGSNAASLLMDLQRGGVSQFSVRKDGIVNATGSMTAAGVTATSSGLAVLQLSSTASYGFHLARDYVVSWGNNATLNGSLDLILSRRGAANLRLGAADAAAPVAQTLSVQSVVAGTTNTAGTNFTFTGSQGTGTGAGGSLIFQVAPAGSSGSAQNALSTALTINSARQLLISDGSAALPSVAFATATATGFYQNGGNLAITRGTNLVAQFGGSNFQFSSSYGLEFSFGGGPILIYDAANTLALRNGTNGQEQRTYGTFTDASNYRRVAAGMSTAGVGFIRPEGAGTGASGNVIHISGLPTSNPGPGILWNNAGTPAIGT
jgi:hypothetical protein